MSEPLRDFRGKFTAATDVMLEARARVTGKDKSEICREVMHEWAMRELDVAKVAHRLAAVEGISMSTEGQRK